MNTASPATKSAEENVQSLNTVCHVVEVKDAYALVHASPNALAQIIGSLGFTVSPSKRGGDYYAVQVAAKAAPAPRTARPAPAAPVSGPRLSAAPAAPAAPSGAMNIGGSMYSVSETATKRSQDVRRWEVTKEDGTMYVVTFQAHDGSRTACSCKGGIFHKHCKHMDAMRAAHGRRAQVA